MEACRNNRQQVLETFAPGGRLRRLPMRHGKRRILLEEFARLLEPGRIYPEAELNALFAAFYPDPCTVRRELVDAGLLQREAMLYRGTGVDGPSWLKAQEKGEAPHAVPGHEAGVYAIVHLSSSKVFVGRGGGVVQRLKSQRSQLDLGTHRCAALQEDWQRHGAGAFQFRVLALLDPVEGESDFLRGRRLAHLEAQCVEALGEMQRYL